MGDLAVKNVAQIPPSTLPLLCFFFPILSLRFCHSFSFRSCSVVDLSSSQLLKVVDKFFRLDAGEFFAPVAQR